MTSFVQALRLWWIKNPTLGVFCLSYALIVVGYSGYWPYAFPHYDDPFLITVASEFDWKKWFAEGLTTIHHVYPGWEQEQNQIQRPMQIFYIWAMRFFGSDPFALFSYYKLLLLFGTYFWHALLVAIVFTCSRNINGQNMMTSLFLAGLMLFSPTANSNFQPYNPIFGFDLMSTLFFGFMLLAIIKNRPWFMVTMAVLSIFTKENAAPGLVITGLFCLMIPKRRVMGLGALVSVLLWFGLRAFSFGYSLENTSVEWNLARFDPRILLNYPFFGYEFLTYKRINESLFIFPIVANLIVYLIIGSTIWRSIKINWKGDRIFLLWRRWVESMDDPNRFLKWLCLSLTIGYIPYVIIITTGYVGDPRYFSTPFLAFLIWLGCMRSIPYKPVVLPGFMFVGFLTSAPAYLDFEKQTEVHTLYAKASALAKQISDRHAASPISTLYFGNGRFFYNASAQSLARFLKIPKVVKLHSSLKILSEEGKDKKGGRKERITVIKNGEEWNVRAKASGEHLFVFEFTDRNKIIDSHYRRRNLKYRFESEDALTAIKGRKFTTPVGRDMGITINRPEPGAVLLLYDNNTGRWRFHD